MRRVMAGYQRKTAFSPKEVLATAESFLPSFVGLSRAKGSGHSATYNGAEGSVTVSAHRHGAYTAVVANTDQLRTSRLDYEVQRFLNQLPYEPGDAGGPGSGEPTRASL
ncbi:MAG: hypothetical protein O2958_00145 [Gemmatimonadetes bacterium]|nr:hypothetical protein [Gemmatimonadota bacterium]MDA1104448.1 hypothetical protein [Gemmatimonadota bacterium]